MASSTDASSVRPENRAMICRDGRDVGPARPRLTGTICAGCIATKVSDLNQTE